MLVLEADGLDPIDLDDYPTEHFVCETWAIGPPAIRTVVESRTMASGTIDWTRFVGSRSVTLTVVALEHPDRGLSVQGQLDRLAAFCRPELRPTLTWNVGSDAARTVYLRANPGLDVEWGGGGASLVWRRCGLSFVVPDSLVWQAGPSETREVFPTLGAEAGRRYDEEQVPRNLLSDNQASMETDASGWAGEASTTLARGTERATHGAASLRMTATTATIVATMALPGAPVVAGETYSLTGQAYTTVAGRALTWGLRFFDAGGAQVGGDSARVDVPLTPNAWTPVRYEVAVPAGAVTARPRGFISGVTVGEVAWLDSVGIFTGSGQYAWYLPSQGGTTGRGYDRLYPAGDSTNVLIINPGQVTVPWTARIYGPCTNPRLYNDTSGEGLIFTANGGLALGAGESALLDSAARSVTVEGANRYDRLNLAVSSWWSLYPGDNRIRLQPDQFSPGCQAEITWRPAWL
jgi:hypothetical protein